MKPVRCIYSADKALQIFTYLEGSEDAKGFLGHLFERLVHNKFTKGYRARELRPLSEDVDEVLLPATNPGCLEFDTLDSLNLGIRLKPELEVLYLKPTVKNLPAVDSLFYTKTGNTYSVFFLQITVSLNHPVKVKPLGLRKLYEALPGALRKPQTNLYFVFVVQERIAPEYRLQPYLDSGKSYTLDEPCLKRMTQFVLGFDPEDLYDVVKPEPASKRVKHACVGRRPGLPQPSDDECRCCRCCVCSLCPLAFFDDEVCSFLFVLFSSRSVGGVRSVGLVQYRLGFWLSFDPIYTSLHTHHPPPILPSSFVRSLLSTA
jgi:hypothetical protein